MIHTDTNPVTTTPGMSGHINMIHSRAEDLRAQSRELLQKVSGCAQEDVPKPALCEGGMIGDLSSVYHVLEDACNALSAVRDRL